MSEKGGIVLNYFGVNGFLKDRAGRINGVKAKENCSGDEFLIRGKVIINATGIFADDLHRMDNPDSKPTIKPSQGVHLVLPESFLPGNYSYNDPKNR